MSNDKNKAAPPVARTVVPLSFSFALSRFSFLLLSFFFFLDLSYSSFALFFPTVCFFSSASLSTGKLRCSDNAEGLKALGFYLEYHVAWLRNGRIRLTNCMRTQPRWMAERRDILGSLPMSKVFLPGTHDSASYFIHERAHSENFVERYVITQVISRSCYPEIA